jgi:protease-4
MDGPKNRRTLHVLAWVAIWIVLPLALGTILALVWIRPPQVGVIRFQGVIWSESADAVGALLDYVQEEKRIRAVVLEIDSPGGEVTPTEEIYYRLLELREHKPVVVSIGNVAASGGYYMAAAGDLIYAKPASLVGNVGVISFLPSADDQRFTDEDFVSTGPFKFSGGSRGDSMRQIELTKLTFLESVYSQRGDRLLVEREVLAGGEIYMGMQAVRMGLIDALGAGSEAIDRAAEMAGLARYEVLDVNRQVYGEASPEAPLAYHRLRALARKAGGGWRQGLYYLYVEPQGKVR